MADTLRKKNHISEDELMKLKETLASLRTSTQLIQEDSMPFITDGAQRVNTKILREKCKLMQAQINNLEKKSLMTFPDDIDVQYFAVKDDLLTRIHQNKELSAFLAVQKKETRESLEREELVNKELRAVVEAIEMKLQETAQEKHSKSEVLKRLEAKCVAVDKINSQKWRDMSTFLDHQYPLPDEEAFRKVKKKVCDGEEANLMTLADLFPLKTIVKELMKACVDKPNEPYLEIDHRYWPPYVDLLLQCDIALRHPAHCGRIKLMPFHL